MYLKYSNTVTIDGSEEGNNLLYRSIKNWCFWKEKSLNNNDKF